MILPTSEYTRNLKSVLPASAFDPAPRRLAWLAVHVAIVATGTFAITRGLGGWPATLALTLIIGHSFGAGAFVAHEILHGAVIRNGAARGLLGWLSFLPFCVSPLLWVAWHNKVHHGHTGLTGTDPDTYPTLTQYHESRAIRFIDHISPGARRVAGALTFAFGFTAQSLTLLLSSRQALGFSVRQRRVAIAQTLAGALVWSLLAYFIGARAFVFAFLVPLLIGNVIVMGYILTNHSLSPLTAVNDPLLNTLSVRMPRIFEIAHLNFGYHVEHHLFPSMSSSHAPQVRRALLEKWPERYQSMPMGQALWRLLVTPRIYKDSVTLLDPRSGRQSSTLLPR